MRAVWYEGPRDYEVTERPDPVAGPGEVRLRVRAAGVCGTDVHLHHGGFSPRYPYTPGHEIVGEVESLGEGVTSPAPGTLVAVDNRISCGTCRRCRRAEPAFCTRLRDLGVTEPGGFAEYVVVPAGRCHPADGLPLDVLALAEPMACAVHGMDVLAASPGVDALVLGAGTTGLLLAQLLRRSGAWRTTVAAPTQAKLDLATRYGADRTVVVDRDGTSWVDELRELAPDGFDVVVDATGAPSVQAHCVSLVADGGTVLFYGMAPEGETMAISANEIFRRELTIKGSFTQAYSFDRGLAALRAGVVRTDGMVTHHFGLDEYGTALETVASDRSCIKALIHPDPTAVRP